MSSLDCSSQVNGPEADLVMSKHWLGLKQAMLGVVANSVDPTIDQIAYILRIDGKFGSFDLDGVDLRYSKWFRRYRYVQIDIGVPIRRWEGRSDVEIAQFLAESLRQSVVLVKAVCDRAKLSCDEAALQTEIDQVAAAYLEQWAEEE
jgi:hypothetical protein